MGGVEYSAEYVRLWNLISRCQSCMKFRKLEEKGVEVRIVVEGNKLRILRRRTGTAKPCIENCDRMTAEERAMYDLSRFHELQELYEPVEVDYTEDNEREKVWLRAEMNSFL